MNYLKILLAFAFVAIFSSVFAGDWTSIGNNSYEWTTETTSDLRLNWYATEGDYTFVYFSTTGYAQWHSAYFDSKNNPRMLAMLINMQVNPPSGFKIIVRGSVERTIQCSFNGNQGWKTPFELVNLWTLVN